MAGNSVGAYKRIEVVKEKNEKIASSVDDWIKERKEEIANYVHPVLKYRQLGVGLYELYYEAGGEAPYEFSGLYTSVREAQRAIDRHTEKCRAKQ